jgi:hypothetical protein
MLDKFSKYVPAVSPLAVAAPASEGRSATSREVAGRKRYLRFSCRWLVAVAVLAISPIAHADPVHMACSGARMLPNRRVDTNSVLSLTIDLRAGTVTVGGYQPVGILPASPESGVQDSENNEVSFIGSIQGVSSGSVDRVTGEANITFCVHTPQERFFSGICRPVQKLF